MRKEGGAEGQTDGRDRASVAIQCGSGDARESIGDEAIFLGPAAC